MAAALVLAAAWRACAVTEDAVPRAAATDAPPAAAAPVRFIAVGDVGKIDDTQRRVAEAIGRVCRLRGCDFALLLGDNLYPRGMDSDDDPRMEQAFADIYGPLGLEFKAVLGNHDYGHAERERAERQLRYAARTPKFTMPDRTYSFTAGDAAFFALDTDQVFFHGVGEQGPWVQAAMERTDRRWRVVFGHHPYRSNGPHGNAGAYEGWSGVPWLSGNALRSLFTDYVAPGADLYLSGHDHNLQAMRHGDLPLIVSGAGASARPLVERGNRLDLGFAEPGFFWITLDEDAHVVAYDAGGEVLGEVRYAHRRARR